MSSNDNPIINSAATFEPLADLRRGKRRAAMVFVGDSNVLFSTAGYCDGLEAAAPGAGVPIFATPLIGYGGGSNVGVGSLGSDVQATAETESLATVPAQLSGFIPSATHMAMMQPYWRSTNVTAGNGRGYQLNASNALGNNGAIRGHWWFGTGPSWGGTVRCGFRLGDSPFTQHVNVEQVLAGAGGAAWGLSRRTVDLPAGTNPAGNALLHQVFQPGQAQTAPIFCPFMCCERTDRPTGVMAAPLVFAASQHLGTIEAVYRSSCPDNFKIAHIQALATMVGDGGFLMWFVISGINDVTNSRSPATFVADFERFRAEVVRVSALAGISIERHLFFPMVTHPQNNSGTDATLRSYISALTEHAPRVPNVTPINLHASRFGGAADWTARHDAGGAPHLKNTAAGYQAVGDVLWPLLLRGAERLRRGRVAARAVGAGVV